jgi:formylglycine-generating enzyme required for sulfatase activity
MTLSKHITSSQPQQSYILPAPTPIIGSLIVSGTPINADVTLDGKAVGQLPLKLNDILVGEHKLTVSKSGYQPYTATVTVAEGKTATVNATLKKGLDFGDIDMVFVKGGTFTMGATSEQGSGAASNEKPTHSVTLSDYYIGKYEVTQAQWRAVMGNNPSYFKGDNLPVECVSWNDVQVFIQRLNERTGKNFRLPTEAEWEYAARGGSQSKGYKYSGSNTLDDVAWYYSNSSSKIHPVGHKRPNELGIYDMSGNVWEWCQDWYGGYGSSSQTNPTGPSSGSYRVLRGGNRLDIANFCRVSFRSNYNPRTRYYDGGFRLACAVE